MEVTSSQYSLQLRCADLESELMQLKDSPPTKLPPKPASMRVKSSSSQIDAKVARNKSFLKSLNAVKVNEHDPILVPGMRKALM